MIKSFRCKQTQSLFEGGSPKRFRPFQAAAERKLQQLDSATTLKFLRSPPGNHLKALTGDRKTFFSIRVNNQWRLCFEWCSGHAFNVEIVDYH